VPNSGAWTLSGSLCSSGVSDPTICNFQTTPITTTGEYLFQLKGETASGLTTYSNIATVWVYPNLCSPGPCTVNVYNPAKLAVNATLVNNPCPLSYAVRLCTQWTYTYIAEAGNENYSFSSYPNSIIINTPSSSDSVPPSTQVPPSVGGAGPSPGITIPIPIIPTVITLPVNVTTAPQPSCQQIPGQSQGIKALTSFFAAGYTIKTYVPALAIGANEVSTYSQFIPYWVTIMLSSLLLSVAFFRYWGMHRQSKPKGARIAYWMGISFLIIAVTLGIVFLNVQSEISLCSA
jgi:hypothetical protein